ncbi:TPA: tetratricopeptide repeat protein [Providencia rettgeri]
MKRVLMIGILTSLLSGCYESEVPCDVSDKLLCIYAENGITKSQIELAAIYYEGDYSKPDYNKAFYWGEKAALSGDVDAQTMIGEMYYRGKGVEQDYSKAFHWFTEADKQGDDFAKEMLGVMYYDGRGVDENETLAYEYFKKACEAGRPFSCSRYNNSKEINLK